MPKSIKCLYSDAKSDVNTLERIYVVIVNSKQVIKIILRLTEM